MPAPRSRAPALEIHPVTPARWRDLAALFGPRGACAGCWCTWWRLSRAEFEAGKGEANRRRLEAYVRAGHVPGLLAYERGEPVGWVAVEPREAYSRLGRSRALARVDERPVWSVTCFFVARDRRGSGIARALLEAAARHARRRGATLLEGYPVDVREAARDDSVYTGVLSTFRALGFAEVARRTPRRPIVRKALRGRARSPAPATKGAPSRRRPGARGRGRGRVTS